MELRLLVQSATCLIRSAREAPSVGQGTQREAADKWKVDGSTVAVICRAAEQGALARLSARPDRRGKSAEQAVALHWTRGTRVGSDRRPGPAAGGHIRQGRDARSEVLVLTGCRS